MRHRRQRMRKETGEVQLCQKDNRFMITVLLSICNPIPGFLQQISHQNKWPQYFAEVAAFNGGVYEGIRCPFIHALYISRVISILRILEYHP